MKLFNIVIDPNPKGEYLTQLMIPANDLSEAWRKGEERCKAEDLGKVVKVFTLWDLPEDGENGKNV